MNILMITDNDPAGMGIAFTNAINQYTDHRCRLISSSERYGFQYETDIHLPDLDAGGYDEVAHLLQHADIIHFHMLRDENDSLGPLAIRDYITGKKIIHHHHGHPVFRANPAPFREKYKKSGRKSLVSTPDLLNLLPEATWIPNPVSLADPLLQPRNSPLEGPVIIGQAPTRKDLKNTEDLRQVFAGLRTEPGLPDMVLNIIELMPHRQCLEAKNRCHIIFDHLQGYYGVSSLESLAQGKPVIAGLDEWNIRCIREFTGWDILPWHVAKNKDELRQTLIRLIEDNDLRLVSGKNSRRFMEEAWNERRVLDLLFDFYRTC